MVLSKIILYRFQDGCNSEAPTPPMKQEMAEGKAYRWPGAPPAIPTEAQLWEGQRLDLEVFCSTNYRAFYFRAILKGRWIGLL